MINDKTNNGLLTSYFWSGSQKFGVLFLQFVSNIILARILSPDDFGYIGIIAVIVNIMQAVVEGGFGSAIVQRKKLSQADLSTVFICNFTVAIVLYILLVFSSGALASYYRLPNLDMYVNAEGAILIINALCIVQMNILIREMKFRSFFIANFASVLTSVLLAICCALSGFGVWSFVIRDLSKEILLLLLLMLYSPWRPQHLIFSKASFSGIFSYSFPILLASLTRRIYDSVQALVIGRQNPPAQLGFYTQAKKMEEVPISGYADAASQVIFPALSREYEKSKEKGNIFLRRNIKIMNYLIIPIVAIAELCSDSIFHLLFGEKWNESIPMFRILCLAGITIPAVKASSEALKAVGRSDLFFTVQLIQRIVGFILILVSSYWGLQAVLWALVFNSIIFYISNMYFNKHILSYPYKYQLLDLLLYLLLGVVIYLPINTLVHEYWIHNDWMTIMIVPMAYIIVYGGCSYLIRFDVVKDILTTLKKTKL